ncbi:hypothetical protein SGQ83_18060 [Flavobacterium sp. Fl-318]|uniref:Uncharacterized protein n=1 Tax=Flavobacterium cupriresistens TaxID=2893885 RepID=A0ABU4RF82_9FLAO|nr:MULTISPECIES: hypothetical protein [unclassified Flavobacterium]MDX6191264.1 hypothetical protein [Flavobacterium sp. Fl-318]UFH42417.1 hypothetical protein LNP23_21740 [Flavobacterium sp. F-323]
MKKIIVLLVAIMVHVSVSQAQTAEETQIKSELKAVDKNDPNAKKEKQDLRKELRKLEGQDVSSTTRDQFKSDFGNTTAAKWKRSDYYDEASFTKDGAASTAFYDANSKLVGTMTAKNITDLPAKALKIINDKYKEYTKKQVSFYNDNESNDSNLLWYDKKFADTDNYFVEVSKDGKNSVLQITAKGEVSFFSDMK